MKIIVKESNKAKINVACNITATEGLNYYDVTRAVQLADKILADIPKKSQTGITVEFSSGGRVPNMYHWPASRIEGVIERFSSGWGLVEVRKGDCPKASYGTSGNRISKITISLEQSAIQSAHWQTKNHIEVVSYV